MAKPRGGKREGAGRPKGTLNPSTITKEQARDALRQIVLREMDALASAQIAHAKGLKYLVARETKTGKFTRLTQEQTEKILAGESSEFAFIEVWEKDPSVQAFTDLMNRALDKPKEQDQDVNANVALRILWGGDSEKQA
jgi:hypothetical protein